MATKVKLSKARKIVTWAVCGVMILVLIAAMIVANYFLNLYSPLLHAYFGEDTADTTSEEVQEAFKYSDGIIRDAAADSMVLLENKGGYLPKKNLKKVNLFGWGSTSNGLLLTGGGSGGTSITDDSQYKLDLDDAFAEDEIEINTTLYNDYMAFSDFDADWRASGSTNAGVIESLKNPDASFYSAARMNQAKSFSPVAVAVLTRWGAENVANSSVDELKNMPGFSNGAFLRLTTEEKAMFDALEANEFEVIVVLNVCNNIELGFVEEYSSIKACIFAGIPGQSGLSAIPKIITGKVNPSGRTADVMPYSNTEFNPTDFNATKSGSHITYQEGIYFGYKWYETADVDGFFSAKGKTYDEVVQYPFGYGLSYTTFEWTPHFPAETELTKDGKYTVTVDVKNTGDVAGKDVVQLYGHTTYGGTIEKPDRILLDFAKTPEIEPGETETVTLEFTAYDLASYDAYDRNSNDFCGYEVEFDLGIEITVQTDSHDKQLANSHFMTCAGIQFDVDPVTGESVVNRFTGDTAYAGRPIDGGAANGDSGVYPFGEFDYLSRANCFANYSSLKKIGAPGGNGNRLVSSAFDFSYQGYKDKDTSNIRYGVDAGMRLMRVQNGEGDDATYTNATYAQLAGEESANLVFNTELLQMLVDYDNVEVWDAFLNQLTEAEIVKIIGNGNFQTVALESVGKSRAMDKDGPAGFNNNVTKPGKSTEFPLLPAENLLGCSFNKATARSIGLAQAKVAVEAGVQGWYAPGVNLHRNVFNARNYEYFSEDAVLSGVLAAELIDEAKANNLYCYLKHMAVSEEGINPKNVNTWLTEQTLREVYLRPFEIAVKRGGANAIMSAFNCVGAVSSGYNQAMLTGVLRDEWGFHGSVITDWYDGGAYMNSHTNGVLAGNNLWLSGSTGGDANINLSDNGVKYAARQSVKNILYTYIDTYVTATSIKVTPAPYSPLFITLWSLVNAVLAIGMLTCLAFIVLAFFGLPKTRAKAAVQTANADAEQVNADGEISDGTDSASAEEQTTEAPADGADETEAEAETGSKDGPTEDKQDAEE